MVGVTVGQEAVILTTLEEQVVRPAAGVLVGGITTAEAEVQQERLAESEKSEYLAGR